MRTFTASVERGAETKLYVGIVETRQTIAGAFERLKEK